MGATDLRPPRDVAEELEHEAGALWRPSQRGNQRIRDLEEIIRTLALERRTVTESDRTLRERARERDEATRRLKEARLEREASAIYLERHGPLHRVRAKLTRIEELMAEAKQLGAPYEILCVVAAERKLPVPNFAAGGIATPADASLMMQLGAESIFVGSGIFKSDEPQKRAQAIVRAVTHFEDPKIIAEVSRGLGKAMDGIETSNLPEAELMQTRGW